MQGDGDQQWARLDHLDNIALGHLHRWALAVIRQADRVLDPRANPQVQQNDAALLVLALRDVRRAAAFVRDEVDGVRADGVRAALARFDDALPHTKQARDVLEHFDVYERGKGDLQQGGSRSGRKPSEAAASLYQFHFAQTPGRYTVGLGPLEIEVSAARTAARRLSQEVYMAQRGDVESTPNDTGEQ